MAFGFNMDSAPVKEIPKGVDICIVSGEPVTVRRYKVKDDAIITAIRNVKNKFGLGTNNRLYVAPENYEAYRKKRSKFEQKVVLLGAFGILISVFVIGANLLLRGTVDIVQVLSSIALTIFLVALAFVDYVPAVEDLQAKAASGRQAEAKPAPAMGKPLAPAPMPKPAMAAPAKASRPGPAAKKAKAGKSKPASGRKRRRKR